MKIRKGFTLIELLVVISIIVILFGLSIFGLQGARKSARDAKRKADLESIRSALELFKSDCNVYPTVNAGEFLPSPLINTNVDVENCSADNVYMAAVPSDPDPDNRSYSYVNTSTDIKNSYILCASLEQAPAPAMDTNGCGSCGSNSCNYIVSSP